MPYHLFIPKVKKILLILSFLFVGSLLSACNDDSNASNSSNKGDSNTSQPHDKDDTNPDSDPSNTPDKDSENKLNCAP